jgi:cyclic pyranopterin phosphate synthase
MGELTHFNAAGEAHTVDVSAKAATERIAVAEGKIYVNEAVFGAVSSGTAKKGDVLAVARIGGIQAAKRTFELIPLCHLVGLTHCSIDFTLNEEERSITAQCTAKTTGQTGVEMEALTGVSAALLTVYDMCKALDRAMRIENIHLLVKDGGKSGRYCAADAPKGGSL